jgi:predicted ATPase
MITQIKLDNFKCFEQEIFEMAPLTLFAGINGMGKSSVIQSLLLLKQSYKNTYLQTQNKVTLYNNSFVDLETCGDLCYKNASPKNVGIEMELKNEEKHSWLINATDQDAFEAKVEYSGPGGYDKCALFSEEFIYLTAERFGPRKSYSLNPAVKTFNTKLGIQGELTPGFIQKASAGDLELGIEKLRHPSLRHKIKSEQENPNLLYQNLNLWISEILGRSATARVTPIDKENVKLSFNIRGNKSGDLSALQVGFGFSFSLPVILAPLVAKPGDLIIIENPEAHLHPSAQSKIGKLLALAAQNGVQVIIETHSDHVLNGIRVMIHGDDVLGKVNADIFKTHFFYLDGDAQERRVLNAKPGGKLTGWPAGFFDEWENNLRTLVK